MLNSISEWTDVNLLGMNEFVRLVEHGDYYFFAGDVFKYKGISSNGMVEHMTNMIGKSVYEVLSIVFIKK